MAIPKRPVTRGVFRAPMLACAQLAALFAISGQALGQQHADASFTAASFTAQTGSGASRVGSTLLDAPTVTKTFEPPMVAVGGTSQMTIALANPNSSPIVGVQVVDNYPIETLIKGVDPIPTGMANASINPVVSDTCGFTEDVPGDRGWAGLTNGTIPANDSCKIVINVVGVLVGSFVNHTGAVTSNNALAGADATAPLTIDSDLLPIAPTVSKAFAPMSVTVGDVSQMTIKLSNSNDAAIIGAQVNDIYPAGMANASVSPVVSDTCNFVEDVPVNGAWAKLSNGTIPAHDSCEIVVNVMGASPGALNNETRDVPSGNALSGASASATLVVSDPQGSRAPLAVGDAIEVAPNDIAVTIVGDLNTPNSVLDNDFDPDAGDVLTAVRIASPQHGTLSLASDGQFTYQNTSSASTDSFTYIACDNHGICSAPTTVLITIGDGLHNHLPFAVGDAIEVAPGDISTALVGDTHDSDSLLDNDRDLDAGDILTASKLTDPEHGTASVNADGTFSYRNTSSATVDEFLYAACDGHGACDVGVVSITIGNSLSNHLPIVVDDAIQVAPGGMTSALIGDPNISDSSVLDNDYDPDSGDVLRAVKVSGLLNASGTLTFNGDGTFAYQNQDPLVTSDIFLYEACDNLGACTLGIVNITIGNAPPDLPPIAMDDAIVVGPNGTATTLVGGAGSVLANDSDPDLADTLNAYLIHPASSGDVTLNVDGTFVYTNTNPNAASDSIQYEACDTYGACVAATVSITINGDAPTVTCTLPKQVDVVGDTVNFDLSLLFQSPAGQSLSYSATDLPPSLSIMGSLLTGTLDASGTYTSALIATTVPGGVSAREDVFFQVLPTGEILLRDGFDGANPPPLCM